MPLAITIMSLDDFFPPAITALFQNRIKSDNATSSRVDNGGREDVPLNNENEVMDERVGIIFPSDAEK